ncbi:nucleotidyltransferase domain-containing protein [candidate division KSB3 bacterium]|uniref:Nucleotidyltransferase domain-containing protein n=1 Tax=candidate division KSB3 bacterium TaxID=2044937 RepID=A0A9D5Q5C8_9BACT|nr:nucleotidyltransferase domain-containing protein [candidate division KSB3 bacterium]MBD3324480.1 nucleotidyltransferase domain-containing protein [candidate division KSB3 bacterium]
MNTQTISLSKGQIKQAVVEAIKDDHDIQKIIVFGSFLASDTPQDIDVAVVGNFSAGYLDVATRLRKKVRHIAKILPVDIIPLQANSPQTRFVQEIENGEVIYEKRNAPVA